MRRHFADVYKKSRPQLFDDLLSPFSSSVNGLFFLCRHRCGSAILLKIFVKCYRTEMPKFCFFTRKFAIPYRQFLPLAIRPHVYALHHKTLRDVQGLRPPTKLSLLPSQIIYGGACTAPFPYFFEKNYVSRWLSIFL